VSRGNGLTLPTVDRDDPTPKYLQAEQIITAAIREGRLAAGAKLPPTKVVGSMVNVSLITAHKAMERLVEAGLLRREVGRGTYVCDNVADVIASRKQSAIALVLDQRININDYYHGSILDGLRQAARKDDEHIEFFFQDCDSVRRMRPRRAAGAICLHPTEEYQSAIEDLQGSMPVVLLGGTFASKSIPYVDCDNYDGARNAVRHLAELGHQRFLVLSGPTNLSNSRDRAEGARDEIRSQGHALADDDLVVCPDSLAFDDATAQRVTERMTRANRPTAIVAGGFYLALNALQLLRRAGLAIPRDVSIVGFDDPQSAPLLDPPLTTVRQPLEKMAHKAYEVVRRALHEGAGDVTSHEIPTELVIRESTGSPAD
jgi:DNA-binding LacI/PurR family transcriptional regulator